MINYRITKNTLKMRNIFKILKKNFVSIKNYKINLLIIRDIEENYVFKFFYCEGGGLVSGFLLKIVFINYCFELQIVDIF